MPTLAFVLLKEPAQPDADKIAGAAAELGLTLTPAPPVGGEEEDGPVTFELEGGAGRLLVMMIAAPHPDVPDMAIGPLSPPPEELQAAKAHCIVTALGLEGDNRAKDQLMTVATGAVVRALPAVGAMLGHGVLFYGAELFADFAQLAADEDMLPVEISVDVTAAQEDGGRMSFLTHGMTRYGREELYVTCPVEGQGALDFVLSLVRWMAYDPDVQLPTGDTVGRTDEEKVPVQRVESPIGEGPDVIRLDLG